jgi:TonB-linked SusC/RagA family outer membrane protein
MQRLSRVPGWQFIRRGAMTLISVAFALPVAATIAAAQTGTIVGTITDQTTKTGIPSVNVQIVGSTRGVVSGPDGHFRINGVASGPAQIRATRIGYAAATQTISVPTGDVVTADFALSATQVTLDQVVVTGTSANERLRETGNLVAVVQADSINKGAVETFSDLLAGKAAGVQIDQQSGEVGSSSRIRIRGNNSVSLNNDPLLVVDGVFVNNNSASTPTAIFTGGQQTSRFDDLDPNQIENIEVLKGPSASALYGTAGANGVILVTTKKGSTGHAVWTAHTDYGQTFQAGVYQANFGQVGTLAPQFVAPGGSARTTGCTLQAQAANVCTATKDSLLQWNPLMSSLYNPFTHNNPRDQFGGSVAGGSDVTKYFLSGDYGNDHGVQPNNYDTKNNGRANFLATPSSKTDVSLNLGYIQSRLILPQNDNNEAGAIAAGQLGQPINDARHGYFVLITPQESDSIAVNQAIERFTGGITGNWRPLSWLTLTGVGGMDVTNQNDFQLTPINTEAAFSAVGATGVAESIPSENQVYTAQLNAGAQYNVSSSIHGTSSLGTQYTNNIFRSTTASGVGLTPGTASVGGTTNQFTAAQIGNNQVVDVGYYAQQQFAWRDKVFINGAVRLDDNSSFGQVYTPSYYPSVSASWVIGEEPWFPKGAILSSLRLRTAYGFSGQHPGFQQAQAFLNGIAANLRPFEEISGVTTGGFGNQNLKPERSGEFEGGFDIGFWHDRLNLQATGYSKATTDALVAVNLAPSVGGITVGTFAGTATRFQNIGQVDNRGLELGLTANLINGRNTRLDVTVNDAYNRNKVITLGPNIAPIQFNSVNNGPPPQRIQAGYSIGGWWQPSYSYSDLNHDGIIEPNEVNVASATTFQGNRDPAQQFSISPQLTILKYFKISTLFDNVMDVEDLNFTSAFRCSAFSNCQWDYDPHTTLQHQAVIVADTKGTDNGYLEDGSFWKWRELSVRASAPDGWARRLRVSALSFTVAGRNLRTWSKYTGLDPEINSTPGLGAAQSAQSEFFTQGVLRFWTGRFDLTF